MTNLIDYVKEYNFEKIKECVENGENINQVNEEGESIFTVFIDSYYSSKDFLSEKEYATYFENSNDERIENDLGYIMESSTIPLDNRKGFIKDKLDWFIKKGTNINYRELVDNDYGYGSTALVYAVSNLDYPMTEYLLERGANPKLWLSYEDEINGIEKYDTFLFDDLDINMLDSICYPEKVQLILKITSLLAKHIEENYNGMTLTVDHDERIVKAAEPKWRY